MPAIALVMSCVPEDPLTTIASHSSLQVQLWAKHLPEFAA